MKQVIRLTESDLNKVINECVTKLLKEGHWDQQVFNEWENIREALGDEQMLMELYNYLDGDTIVDFIQSAKSSYDLDYNEQEEI